MDLESTISMLDIRIANTDVIEVLIAPSNIPNTLTLWVNVNGICRLRVSNIRSTQLTLDI